MFRLSLASGGDNRPASTWRWYCRHIAGRAPSQGATGRPCEVNKYLDVFCIVWHDSAPGPFVAARLMRWESSNSSSSGLIDRVSPLLLPELPSDSSIALRAFFITALRMLTSGSNPVYWKSCFSSFLPSTFHDLCFFLLLLFFVPLLFLFPGTVRRYGSLCDLCRRSPHAFSFGFSGSSI